MIFKKILKSTLILTLTLIFLGHAENVIYEKPISGDDYSCKIWTTNRIYDGTFPDAKNQSPQKWYFNIAFFNSDNRLEKAFSFPAALLIREDEFEQFSPRLIGFMPRKNWDREFLTIEDNGLYKYQIWAEKDDKDKFHMSVDFGKRIPLFVSSEKTKLDLKYNPRADESGNIYFRVVTEEGAQPKLLKWNSTTEKVETCKGTDAREVSFADLDLENPSDDDIEIIDPLAIKERFFLDAYKSYGTEAQPVSKEDINFLENFYQMAIGKVIALNKLYQSGEEPVTEFALTSNQKSFLRNTIIEMANAYESKKDLIRELKLVMREKGIMSILKKWLTNLEFDAILAALNPQSGGGGVISKFNHNGKTEFKDGQIVLALGYYRMLKDKCRRGFDKNMWEDYSNKKEKSLRRAIQGYSKKLLKNESLLKSAFSDFQSIREQADWPEWFDKNRNVTIELLFDYLASLRLKKLNDLLEKFISSKIKRTRMLQIIDLYKKSNLYSGAKETK